jgi:hypothetical protein
MTNTSTLIRLPVIAHTFTKASEIHKRCCEKAQAARDEAMALWRAQQQAKAAMETTRVYRKASKV